MALYNADSVSHSITALFADLGWSSTQKVCALRWSRPLCASDWRALTPHPVAQAAVRDLWAHQDLGTVVGQFKATVASHGVSAVTLTPA